MSVTRKVIGDTDHPDAEAVNDRSSKLIAELSEDYDNICIVAVNSTDANSLGLASVHHTSTGILELVDSVIVCIDASLTQFKLDIKNSTTLEAEHKERLLLSFEQALDNIMRKHLNGFIARHTSFASKYLNQTYSGGVH